MDNALKFSRVLYRLAIFSLAFIILSSFSVSATVIGANKGVINWDNVLKNGFAQEQVTLSTDTDFNLSVEYLVEGDIAEWVRLEPAAGTFFISKNSPYTVSVIVEPPGDTMIGKYTGSIRFITGALAGPDGQFGTAVRAAININMGVQVSGQEIVSCSVPQVTMNDVEEGYPVEFYAVISNAGNVRIRPEFILEFWNQDQSRLVKTLTFTSDEQILPTTQKRIFKSLQHNLSIGQYWVKMKTPICGDTGSGFYTVSILERGGVSDKGELLQIENPIDAKVGQIIPVDAVFKNLGSRVVSAKFKGTITSGGKDNIFKLIDTEPIDVPPGATEKLRTYFNPTQEGQYVINGQVLYNRKLTFEKTSILNVYPASLSYVGGGLLNTKTIIIAVLLIAILMMVFLIFKKRKETS